MDISVLSAIFTVIGAISSVLAVIITIRISRGRHIVPSAKDKIFDERSSRRNGVW